MTKNPGDGVIDPELRVHLMDNVYICGSAGFTTGGAANPTMTIAALAHRLGAHLTNNGKVEERSKLKLKSLKNQQAIDQVSS